MGDGAASTATTVAPSAIQTPPMDAVVSPPVPPVMPIVSPIAGPDQTFEDRPVAGSGETNPVSESVKDPSSQITEVNADNNMRTRVVPAPVGGPVSEAKFPVMAPPIPPPAVAEPVFPVQQSGRPRIPVDEVTRLVQEAEQRAKPAKKAAPAIVLESKPPRLVAVAPATVPAPAPVQEQTPATPAEATPVSNLVFMPAVPVTLDIANAPAMAAPESSTTNSSPNPQQTRSSASAVQQFQAPNTNTTFAPNTTATSSEAGFSADSTAIITTSAFAIPSNNVPAFTPQFTASTTATIANLEMTAPMTSTPLLVLVPVAVAVQFGIVLAVWCVRRSTNRKACRALENEEAHAAAWRNQARRPSQDVLLESAPPPEYAYARRSSIISTASKIEGEESGDEIDMLPVAAGPPRPELERVHRVSMFSELTYETDKSTPSPTRQYKRPSDEEIPEILMVSSNIVRVINTPDTDVVSSHVEDTPTAQQISSPKIVFGFVYFEGRRWPVAKAAGGRWVWIGENTQVYRGPHGEEDEVTILSSGMHARAVFDEELSHVQATDPEFIQHWEILLTFF